MRYAIRQDRKVRKPLPGCQLTETEWLACWDTLNKGIESQDDETIQNRKRLSSAIKKTLRKRYPKSKKCVVCGETCANIRTLQKMLASSSNNAVLRSEESSKIVLQINRGLVSYAVEHRFFAGKCAIAATPRCVPINLPRQNS